MGPLSNCGLRVSDDADDPAAALHAELDGAVRSGEQGVVAAAANVVAGVELGATLTNEDLTCADDLTAVTLHAEALGVGVAAVTGGGNALL